MKVIDVYRFINSIAPFSSAASWDNSGLLVGSLENAVSKILVCLDVTATEIEYAKENKVDLIVSHHPVIFKPLSSFISGNIAYEAAINGISIICAHTNLDKAINGVNDTLCDVLGFEYKKQPEDISDGFLNVAELCFSVSADEMAKIISDKLNTRVDFCDTDEKIKMIAVCSGAGADFIYDAKKLGCDAFITGEASYHDFLDAKALGISLFAAGHYETEVIIVEKLTSMLKSEFNDIDIAEYAFANTIKTEN